MNETITDATLASNLSSLEQIFLFISVILILLAGAWVTSVLTGSNAVGASKGKRTNSRSMTKKRNKRQINRQLTLHRIQGDEFGFLAERLLDSLRKEFATNLWTKWTQSNKGLPFQIRTGLAEDDSLNKEKSSRKNFNVKVSLNGTVKNKKLDLHFYPHGPLHIIDPDVENNEIRIPLVQEGEFIEGKEPFKFVYECSDFPLFELKGLSVEPLNRRKQLNDEILLRASIAGVMSRGCGCANQIVSINKLERWAKQLDKHLITEKALSTNSNVELVVITAWCYLIAGLGRQNIEFLRRSLELYQLLTEDHWQGREKAEMAGAQANEAFAAYALMQLIPSDLSYAVQIKQAVQKAIRNFRRDNYPHSWGKLMCKLAFAVSNNMSNHMSLGQQGKSIIEQDEITEKGHTHQSIELALDEAIELWRQNKQEDAMCEAYFAKGKLALNDAKRNMGVQGLERAENGFLASLALSQPESEVHKNNFMKIRKSDIRLELGKLYLSWGTRFGEAELIEKAIHHFESLLEDKLYSSKQSIKETKLALAECYLNYGGISNDGKHHQQAIYRFNDILDMGVSGQTRDKIERGIAVAKARLALIDRKKEQVITAISCICSVIGQNGKLWPTKDVLLRLRARLRELLFVLEGDDIALDRAIKDRRELVKLAEIGVQDVRWAVEISDLVTLLSKRQYKNNGNQEDFNEAHYLLETAISILEKRTEDDEDQFDIPHIKGMLYLNLAKLLASFARVHFDEQALKEAAHYYQKFIGLTPRTTNPTKRAEVLSQIGLIMMDLSEQYGAHEGLKQAISAFAEAHDIYLETGLIDLSNRMRRFLENAQAAHLVYEIPEEETE
ncbi:MAG: hypothetical protein JJ964_04395 [Rhizobiales bacterium]|nr:hypothetical protein [Hyphomicrobiales bacterium]